MISFPDAGALSDQKTLEIVFMDSSIKPLKLNGPFSPVNPQDNTITIKAGNKTVIIDTNTILFAKFSK